ncbi:MAG: helix-turn-helix domain-containing protein [Bacteroidales bacterium]|nr:helix-turn-helix domain-containing protein [Bacteroidales bacterium]MCF8391842.1 helix-turn-helix domain-containing protein [Bacteroidales bacterium]
MTLNRCIQLIFFQTFAFALTAQVPFQHHVADKITEPWRWTGFDELRGRSVRCMTEGSNGDFLFGVEQGIMMYSGYEWTMIPFPDSISGLSVTSLCEGLDGSIWTGTDAGLYIVNGGIWEKVFPVAGLQKAIVNNIVRLPGGSMLAGISETGDDAMISGLLHINQTAVTFYTSTETYQFLTKLSGHQYNLITVPEKLTIKNRNGAGVFSISDLCIQRNGNILIAISNKHGNGKIAICNFQQGAPGNLLVEDVFTEDDGLFIKSSVQITESQAGEIWAVSTAYEFGIQHFKNGSWEEIKISDIFGGIESQNSVMSCSDGSIWIEGHGRIFRKIEDRWTVYQYPEIPITTASRFTFYESSDKKIWVLGVLDELYLFDNTFEKWITYEDLIFQGETSTGNSWYLHSNGKVILNRHGEWFEFGTKDGLMDTPVRIFITSTGMVWAVGSHKQSAATSYFKRDKWVMMIHPELSWGVDYRGCYESDDGSLWFGCSVDIQSAKGQRGGVIKFQTSEDGSLFWTHLPEDGGIIIGNCYGIGSSKDGRLWIGGKPLYTYDGSNFEKYKGFDKLEEYVDYVDTDEQGNLWLASRYYGIFRYDGESWQNYTMMDGLPSNNIINIYAENKSRVWATTHGGISLFDGEIWTNVGFPGMMSFVSEGGSILKGKTGHIWFNMTTNDWVRRGLTQERTNPNAFKFFRTVRYMPDHTPPETSIISYQKQINQREDANVFWSGSDFFNETPSDDLQYSWRLNKETWTSFSNTSFHTFNGLKPGNYQLEVRTRDMGLNIDPSPAIIEFRVLVVWWKHPAFILVASIALGLIVFLQFRILSNNKKLQQLNESLENKSDELNNALTKMQRLVYSRLRFFTNISHEFRTPLGLILGPVEELKEPKNRISNSTRKKYYDIIHRNATRILRLINQILEVYKVEENTLEFSPTRGDLLLQISGIVDLFEHLAYQHGISLKFDHSFKTLAFSYDQDKIEKIIFNLLSNAFRNVPLNGKITVSAELNEKGNIRMVHISVADNGRGILPEDYEKIFERFYHNESGSYRQLHAGTGIGLAYIKDLVKAHNGSIEVSSEPGVETAFVVKIPFIEASEIELIEVESKDSSIESLSGDIYKAIAELRSFLSDKHQEETIEDEDSVHKGEKRATILIVEDDLDTRIFIRHCLENEFNVIEANDGLEGIHVARVEHPDLIISDVMMPEHDGIQFCQIIKTDFDTSHIPFILLSVMATVGDRIKGIEIGADAYLEKPINKKLLLSHIDNLLRSRNMLRKRFHEEIQIRPSEMKMASLDEKFIEKTVELIEKNIDNESLDAETLSREVGVSRIQLYRKTKALTGQTVNQFIRSIRLKKAARLLSEQSMSVSEIAYIVGFSAPNHFASYFKEYFGMTPTEYRDQS